VAAEPRIHSTTRASPWLTPTRAWNCRKAAV